VSSGKRISDVNKATSHKAKTWTPKAWAKATQLCSMRGQDLNSQGQCQGQGHSVMFKARPRARPGSPRPRSYLVKAKPTYMLPWAHPSPHPKWHLDQFSRFCTAQDCDRMTDQQTDATRSVIIGHIYVVVGCGLIMSHAIL